MMKTSEIVYKQGQIDIDIRHRQIINDICVYQVGISSCGIILQNTVRFCYCSELKNLYNYPLKFSNSQTRELDNYNIFRTSIKEAIKENWNKMYENDFKISKINMLDNDIENIMLGKIDLMTDNFYEYNSLYPCPKSMHFDFMYGCVDDRHFKDLNDVVKILKNRKDITLNSDANGVIIQRPPSWYSDIKFIDFKWHPTEEDWNQYVNSKYFESINRYEYIANEILGLKECLLKENNND